MFVILSWILRDCVLGGSTHGGVDLLCVALHMAPLDRVTHTYGGMIFTCLGLGIQSWYFVIA